MRLPLVPGDYGIRAAVFFYRDAYEPSVRFAIDQFVEPGAICYDIGANLGLWSLRMAERAGDAGRVFAFEPEPETAAGLRDNAALSGLVNIEVLGCGLGEEDREATLFVPLDIGRSALTPDSPSDRQLRIAIRRLDDIWDGQGRPKVSFVKMDVEGAEPLVLYGGAEFFASARPVVCCELNPGKLRATGFSPRHVLEFFANAGYRALTWSAGQRELVGYMPDPDEDEVQDLVFVPESLRL